MSWPALYQGMTSVMPQALLYTSGLHTLRKKLVGGDALYQGTTSVVPITPTKWIGL
jgi:hypothetical protein